jgi:hypothetical protein
MTADEILTRLRAPFGTEEIHLKPISVKDKRALSLPYIDARTVMDRLDAVVGILNWEDDYHVQPDGSVVCQLRVRILGEWIRKTDVGSPSEQPDEGDRLKAAFSDSLKRAAVKFGVGRYLYSLPKQWLDYDPVKKCITGKYKFRSEDLPAPPAGPVLAPVPPTAAPGPAPSPAPNKNGSALPNTGNALHGRLAAHEQRLVERGYCAPGALFAHLLKLGAVRGYGPTLGGWDGEALGWAIQEAAAWTQLLAKLPLAESQWQRLTDQIKKRGLDPADFCQHFGVEDVELLPRSQWLAALAYVKQPEPAAAS